MTKKDYRQMLRADVIEQRIKAATEGMPKACYTKLLRLGNGNGVIIADYLIKYKLEATKGVKDSTRDPVRSMSLPDHPFDLSKLVKKHDGPG
jgi:hypothetical protein